MDTEKVIQFIEDKISKIGELESKNAEHPNFIEWHESTKSGIRRNFGNVSTEFKDFDRISFWSSSFEDYADREEYLDGLKRAKITLQVMVDDIRLWGSKPDADSAEIEKLPKNKKSAKSFVQNFYITQQQAQTFTSEINLGQYDPAVKSVAEELLSELQKKDKDKATISTAVKYLADKGIDILIALMMSHYGPK